MTRRDFIGAGAAAALAGCATPGGVVGKNVRAEPPEVQARKRRALESAKELGPTITDVEVRRTRNIAGNRAAFYLDDVIFVFRDLARERPKSCWDHFLLSAFKEAHERYGLKAQFNVFYRNDFYYGARGAEFTLKEMPDTWRDEFQAAKDWFRFGFHSYSEFPDYPWQPSLTDARKEWFLMALSKLGWNDWTVLNDQDAVALERRCADGTAFLAVFNTNFDEMETVRLKAPYVPREVKVLGLDGVWRSVEANVANGELVVPVRVACSHACIMRMLK